MAVTKTLKPTKALNPERLKKIINAAVLGVKRHEWPLPHVGSPNPTFHFTVAKAPKPRISTAVTSANIKPLAQVKLRKP